MATKLPSPKGAEPPFFGPYLLLPNGWMHQDATCNGGRPQPRGLCVRWGPSPLPKKDQSPPIFGPCLLWPNGCMDQDATWYGGRPRHRRHCVRWETSFLLPQKGHNPQFSAHAYCGQTAVCVKMPLGTEVGLSLGHIVLDGNPAPPPLKRRSPNIPRMAVVAKWLDGLRCHLVRR